MAGIKKNPLKRKYSERTLRVFSRHPSHNPLRNSIKTPYLSVLRLGSTTEGTLNYEVELNSTEAIRNSSSKLRMKTKFTEAGVKTADWWLIETLAKGYTAISPKDPSKNMGLSSLPYPIVAKHHFGSRGTGNTLLKSKEELENWIKGKTLSNYIFEKYYNYVREYRLHIHKAGCFYTCRKMLKEETPEQDRWHRHDSNSVWILEDNSSFDKPLNWDDIVEESVKALNAVGLDVGAVDVRVQSSMYKNAPRKDIDFIIVEINSAPSFGSRTLEMYLKELPVLIKNKYYEQRFNALQTSN